MLQFCHQISFTSSAWSHVLQNEQDRFAAVRAPIESLGGKVLAAFFALDSYDVLDLSEFPDDVSLSAISIEYFAGGDVASIHTAKLLGPSDVLQAVQKAGPCSYRPTPRAQALAASAT